MKMIRDSFLARRTLLMESYSTFTQPKETLNLKQNVDCGSCIKII